MISSLRPGRRSLSRAQSALSNLVDRREVLHFLHIGKTAGTQISHLGRQISDRSGLFRFEGHGHAAGLADLPNGSLYFFSTRDPIARFVSGFYSRKRKGMPRTYSEWTPHEALAFAAFDHADDLACQLSDGANRQGEAVAAMRSISHVAMLQGDPFRCMGHFLQLRPPVHILRQERLEEDVAVLARKLRLDVTPRFTSDPVKAHRNDYSDVPPLSETARANLRAWYAGDYAFLRQCEDWIASHP